MAGQRLTKQERSWILYDVGNSALVLLATAVIPIYFKALADGPAMVAWSYASTIASLIIALLMPVLGSLADQQGMKKKFFVGTVGTGIVATVAMGIPTNALVFLVIYVVSQVMLNSSIVFYDALLVDATSDEHMDEVSAQGYAWGYIGSCVPFLACLGVILGRPFGMDLHIAMQISFAITAAWWAIFTVPLLKNVQQTHYKPREQHAVRRAVTGLGATFRRIWADRAIRYFIIAYFFYIDGVHTIIQLSTSYGSDLGIDGTQLVLALLVTQFVAFPSSIIYGRLGHRLGTKVMILVGIVGYGFITLFAALFLRTAAQFWVLALLVGLFQGGIQALSRSMFGKLCPKNHSNEYFGFFDIFGKYAAVLGTFLVGSFTALTGNASLGVLSLAILFAVGFVMMLKVPEPEQ